MVVDEAHPWIVDGEVFDGEGLVSFVAYGDEELACVAGAVACPVGAYVEGCLGGCVGRAG